MAYRDSVISLFSGAGGMSFGFSQAGLKPVIAADINKDACHTYQTNLNYDIFNIDLSIDNSKFNTFIKDVHEPFAIIGGPPCQGFSSAGAKSGIDSRNKLIFNYLSIVEKTQPRWFLFENVEGMLTSNSGKNVVNLIQEFIKLGYKVRLEKVNFAAYGLPQARKRVILMGNRIGLNFLLPSPIYSFDAGKHKNRNQLPFSPTINEALAGLGNVVNRFEEVSQYKSSEPITNFDRSMREGNITNHVSLHFSSVSSSFAKMIAQLQSGQTMKNLPTEFWHRSFEKRAFRRVMDGTPIEKRGGAPSGIKRLAGNLNALTITSASPYEFIHPYEDRPLTLREIARLQSFPDTYHFSGTATSIACQIGNAFPPLVAKVFAAHLIHLDGLFGSGIRTYFANTNGALIGFHLTDATAMSPALARTNLALAALKDPQVTAPVQLVLW